MSESGQYACVTTYSGAGVYYSSNYGQTWSASSGITNAFAIAISASGKNVIAGAINQNPNSIYYSTNYGVSWNLVSSTLVSGSAKINGMSMSYNGQYLLAVTEGGANVLTIAPKRYTTTDVTVSKTGIVVDYIDNTGSAATQTLSVANKTLSIDNGLNVISGDTTLSGALVAAGVSNLQGAVQLDSTLSVASNSALGGTLTVVGAVNMNNTLNVSGASALNSLGVSGGLTSNTVDVSGTSRLRNTLQVDGAATVNSLTVEGASALNSTLAVAGNSALGGTLNVTGASNLASSLVVAGASSLGGSLGVTGATTLGNSLAVTGATTINGVTTINNNVVVNGGSSYSVGGNLYGDYIQVQLSSATPIDSYTIGISSEAAGFLRNPTRYSLVGSNDGTTWFSIDNPSSNVDYIVNGSQKSCTRLISGNYSYYRFIIRSLADTQYWYFFMNYFGLSYNGTSLFNAANPLTGINGSVITNGSLVGTVSYSWYGSRNFDNNTPSNLGRILGNPSIDYNSFVLWWGTSTAQSFAYLTSLYPGGTAGSSAPSTSYTSVTQGSGTFTVNSNSAINAPLTVAGAAQMNSSLGVTGVATMNNDANVGRNLNVSGAAIVTGTTALVGATTVTGAASLGSTLSVAGNSTLGGTLSVAGNSAVGGTLDVTGTSNLGIMNVQGASRLYNVVQVDGAATLGNSLTVAGVATMNNGATVNGTSALNGALTVAGGATLQSSLGVTGAATLSSTLAVTGDTALSNVTVSGNESVAGSLTVVSATALQNTLDVQGASHLHSSAQVDGAVTLGSSLTVAGATTMNGATVNGTVTVTGSTALQSSLGVTGAATLGSTLAVAGATTLTGPSQINNSLGVTGAATLGSVTVSGASQMNSTLAVNGAATLGGTMTVAGATQVNNTLGVTGSAIIGGAMVIAGATQVNNTLGVQGNSTLAGELNVSGIAQLNNALNVTGTTVLSGTLGVIGASTFDDAVDIEGATTLNGVTTVNDNMIVNGNANTGSFTVNTQSAINSTLAVSGATTLGSSIAVVGASTLGSTLAVTGASTLDSTLAVTGASTLGSSLTVAGASQLNNSLAVSGAASLNSTLAVQGNSTFQNNVTVHGNLTVLGGQTSVNTVSMEVKDNAILIADNNTADVLESGLQIQYKPVGASAPLYAGIKRIPVTGQFALFKDATSKISETEPAGQIIQTQQTVYGEWSQLHLATASPITSYQFVARIGGGFEVRSAIEWYVVGSNDESTWTIVDHQTNNSGWNTYTLPAACPSYSYYRFIFTHLNIHILNIRQIILYNNGISLFSSANNYTVAGEYLNILQQNGITVCTMTPSYGFINQLNSNGIISEIPPFPGVYPAFLPTTDGNYVATSGFVVAQVGGSFTYNSNYVATSGTSTVVTVTTITTTTDIYAGIIADSFACASDMNLKKNIVNLDGALDKLDNIRGVYHDWIDENQSKDRQIGVIAQEVEAIYPELVTKGENGYLSVNYPKLTAVLIQAVKELKAIVCGSGHTQTASKKRKQMSSETRKLK
jgi:hypothetical protein